MQDVEYLAEHPEIENPRLSDSSSNRSENDADSRSETDVESLSGDEDASRRATSTSDQEGTFASVQDSMSREGYNNDHDSKHGLTADEARKQFAAARFAEIQAQMDLVTRNLDEVKKLGKKASKHAPCPGEILGKWVLYEREHVSDTADHYRVQLLKTTPKKGKKKSRIYKGKLTVESRGHSKTFNICPFTPPRRITGGSMRVQLTCPDGQPHSCKMVFWGNGMMLVSLPRSLLNNIGGNDFWCELAGIRLTRATKRLAAELRAAVSSINESNENDPDADAGARARAHSRPTKYLARVSRTEAMVGHDRVIRTEPQPGLVPKVENQDLDMVSEDDDQDSKPKSIKAEESRPSDSQDAKWVDDMATTIDTVQKQENLVNQGLIVPLHDIGGDWRFHSPRHYSGLDGRISLLFSVHQSHDNPDQMCAPGHCKNVPTHSDRYPRRIHYCGELLLMAEEGRSDLCWLVRQFDVANYTSPDHMTILLGHRDSRETICMHEWFLGDGTMRIELPTSMVRSYRSEESWISFLGLKHG
jgi:hypothetical protein